MRTPWVRCCPATRMLAVSLLVVASLATMTTSARTMSVCPKSCTCDDEKLVVTCIEANLDVIPITLNPSIRRLVLNLNRIKSVDAAFQFYGELHYVDLSNNHLVSIPTKSFEAQKKLEELRLNHNKISSLSNKTFVGLRSLTVLSLRGNFIEELPDRLFSFLPHLKELDLGQNRISEIDSTAFVGLASLGILYLDDNQLRAVPTHSFDLMTSLAELHVGLNAFTSIPDDAFKGLTRLDILNLAGAGLQNISDNAFRNLTQLRTIVLSDNRLRTIPSKQLNVLPRLEELTIGQNEFPALEAHALKGLPNLKKLDVTGASQLERVEKGALGDNLNLETLILASNKHLSSLEEGSLTGLPNLRHLVLRDNAFTTFHESLANWQELKMLDLAENPLDCQCSLLWLQELLARRNVSQILCVTPPHLKERPLKSLGADELGCALNDTRQQVLIGAIIFCGVVLIFVLGFVLFRYRRRLQDALKDYKWNNRAISRKEHEYQKTFSTDDDYIVRATQQQTLKPIPVTEL